MPCARRPGVLADDTPLEVEQRQVGLWRAMSSIERLALVDDASDAARTLALAGLRERYPQASDRELIARLARLTIGETLASKAYPEFAHLTP